MRAHYKKEHITSKTILHVRAPNKSGHITSKITYQVRAHYE